MSECVRVHTHGRGDLSDYRTSARSRPSGVRLGLFPWPAHRPPSLLRYKEMGEPHSWEQRLQAALTKFKPQLHCFCLRELGRVTQQLWPCLFIWENETDDVNSAGFTGLLRRFNELIYFRYFVKTLACDKDYINIWYFYFITKGFLYLHIKLSINMLFLFLGGRAGKALEAGFLEVWK